MNEKRHSQNEAIVGEESLRVQVEELARDLARKINSGAMEGREGLREAAVELLRGEVEILESARSEGAVLGAPPAAPSANPFAIGIPLFLVGGVMIILFPPVGLLLFAAAAVMVTWGIAAVMLRPVTRR